MHIDCYRNLEISVGPWKCELCEDQDISLETSTTSDISDCNGKKLPFARCSMCHGTSGAFRKTTGGQWVHAFCAEVIIYDNVLLFESLSCLSPISIQTFSVVVGHQLCKGTRKSCGRNGMLLYPLDLYCGFLLVLIHLNQKNFCNRFCCSLIEKLYLSLSGVVTCHLYHLIFLLFNCSIRKAL